MIVAQLTIQTHDEDGNEIAADIFQENINNVFLAVMSDFDDTFRNVLNTALAAKMAEQEGEYPGQMSILEEE